MKQYIAIGIDTNGYNDIDEDFRVFEANNDTDARHYIINHFDCSLDWHFVSNKTISLSKMLTVCSKLLQGRDSKFLRGFANNLINKGVSND
tara:strand:- start:190 stop:462 length:273 start_codon:yes stop_codon:yes gene_type:complete